MTLLRNFTLVAVGILGLAAISASQGFMRPPNIPGDFKPVVGSGAEYKVTDQKGQTHDWAMAVVGKETVDGQDAYWLEMRAGGEGGGTMVMKQLMVAGPGGVEIKRMIVQSPGRPPMEMPVGMMHMGSPPSRAQPASGAGHGTGELVGSESVTVPAGTFDCQHFRSTENGRQADVWASTKVSPYGLVKLTSRGSTIVLEKVLDHETSQIKGEPQKMDFPGMPH